MRNQVAFKVSGKNGLFTDPLTKLGGEKCTLSLPTYEAIKGVCSSIYWKPPLIWIVDEVKILNKIQTEVKGIRPIKYGGGNDLAYYTYLTDVSYAVLAHFEFNKNRPEFKQDWNENKHYFIAKRSIDRGGRRDIFLGARECQCYVEPIKDYYEEKSFYENTPEIDFGFSYHGLTYPDESGKDELVANFWRPVMKNGIVKFCRPEDCPTHRFVRKMTAKKFDNSNYSGFEEAEILDGYTEVGEA